VAVSSVLQHARYYAHVLSRPKQSLDCYDAADVVDEFRALDRLFPAEEIILRRLQEWLPGKSVLDVGVGAGRTTHAFGDKARRYLGVDYSDRMVEACEERFAGARGRFEFRVGDAREIRLWGGPWDLVLFSFNGIDHLGASDRERFFADVRSVLSPSGTFWFSSHNIRSLSTIYALRAGDGAPRRERAYALFSWLMVRLTNQSRRALAGQRHAMINDGSLRFGTRLYYGSVDETVEQLRRAGFDSITVLGMDGRALQGGDYSSADDAWLTYLCASR
jgi:SAM-dependent methyltransferase